MPIAGFSGCANLWQAVPPESWHLLGEISVYRESFSREWTGSSETLEAMLDALIPANPETPKAIACYRLTRLQESGFGLCSP